MDKIRYMQAWLRLHCQADTSMWTEEEILESFCLLPFPHRSFADWSMLVSGDEEPEKSIDPLERLKTQDSELFDLGIVKLGA